VMVEKTILLAILTGALDPMVAFMWGQISVDNAGVMHNFVNAFSFSQEKFAEFQKSLTSETTANVSSVPSTVLEAKVSDDTNLITKSENPMGSTKKPLSQTLALEGLKLVSVLRGVGQEIDSFMNRVKEVPAYQVALENLQAKTEEVQQSPTYRQLQSSSLYMTLKAEVQRMNIGVSELGNKAKEVGMEVVDKLSKTAHPRPPTSPIIINRAEEKLAQEEKKKLEELRKEEKRTQLQAKLEQLQQYNQKLAEERKQSLANTTIKMEGKGSQDAS